MEVLMLLMLHHQAFQVLRRSCHTGQFRSMRRPKSSPLPFRSFGVPRLVLKIVEVELKQNHVAVRQYNYQTLEIFGKFQAERLCKSGLPILWHWQVWKLRVQFLQSSHFESILRRVERMALCAIPFKTRPVATERKANQSEYRDLRSLCALALSSSERNVKGHGKTWETFSNMFKTSQHIPTPF